jgi:hypothetical protein
MPRIRLGLFLTALLGGLVGCNSSTAPQPPALYPTVIVLAFKGTGQPVTEGSVQLGSPTDANLNGHGTSEEDGHFKIHTIFANKRLEGAAEGTYKAIYVPSQGADQLAGPQELGDVTVKAGESNNFSFLVLPPQR